MKLHFRVTVKRHLLTREVMRAVHLFDFKGIVPTGNTMHCGFLIPIWNPS